MTVLFECSEAPSIWGWYTIDILCLMPESFIRAIQKHEMKILSQLVINSSGHPFSQKHLSKKMVVNSSAVMFVLQGASWMSAPRWSVIVMMASNPSSLGRGPTKLIVTELNLWSGTAKGCNRPVYKGNLSL